MNIVLMAGGGGTRLWPLSRQKNPKQFLDLGSGTTLLEQAYGRAKKLTRPDRIFVATAAEYEDKVRKLLAGVQKDNFFFEPVRRNTTAAFATVALRLSERGLGEEPALFMWCDHVFTNEEEFLFDLKKIPALLASYPEALVLIAHTPVTPETGLGYCEVGEKLDEYDDTYWIKGFKEKPDVDTAEQFLAAGTFYWNLGYFSLRPAYLLSELVRATPELAPIIEAYREAIGSHDEKRAHQVYRLFPAQAIEYTFVEKTARRIAITGDYGWSDVGNWAAVQKIYGVHGDHMPHGHHIHIDSKDNFIYNATGKAVSLIGMEDCIVVVTGDAILVTTKEHAHQVKEVVARLEKEGKNEYL